MENINNKEKTSIIRKIWGFLKGGTMVIIVFVAVLFIAEKMFSEKYTLMGVTQAKAPMDKVMVFSFFVTIIIVFIYNKIAKKFSL